MRISFKTELKLIVKSQTNTCCETYLAPSEIECSRLILWNSQSCPVDQVAEQLALSIQKVIVKRSDNISIV